MTRRTWLVPVCALLLVACGGDEAATTPDPGAGDTPATLDAQDVAEAGPTDVATPGDADAASPDPSPADLAPADPGAAEATDATEAFVPHHGAKSLPLYDESTVVDINLTFTDAEWQKFQDIIAYWEAHVDDYSGTTEVDYVHCGVEFNGETFADAGCHPKGNPRYWKDCQKPQIGVKINAWDKAARFLGLRKLGFKSLPYYAAPVRSRLAMTVMRDAGLDAPRVNHARVSRNGVYFGLYENIEAIDHEFLEDHFADPSGNLYQNGYILKTNETANDLTRIWKLNDMIAAEPLDGDHAAFFAWLPTWLDLPEVLRELAAEVVLPTPDNFSNGSSNFYWYDCPARGFVVLPWDIDECIGHLAPPDADIYQYWGEPDAGNPPMKLRQLIHQNAAWKKEFEDDLVDVRDNVYAKLPARVDEICAQIRPAFVADPSPPGTPEAFDADCADLKQRIADRIAYIQQTLGR